MPVVRSASLAEILRACQAQIIAFTSCPPAVVAISAQDDPQHVVGDKECFLRPGSFTSDSQIQDGAGRTCTVFKQDIEALCRTRLYLDQPGQDDAWLGDATLGHIVWYESVASSLQMFFPVDADGNHLVREPLRIIGASRPRKEKQDKGWGEIVVTFDCEYLFLFQQPELP